MTSINFIQMQWGENQRDSKTSKANNFPAVSLNFQPNKIGTNENIFPHQPNVLKRRASEYFQEIL